jgi:heme/copper-type cytochrome/quinol oxidase subunit 1
MGSTSPNTVHLVRELNKITHLDMKKTYSKIGKNFYFYIIGVTILFFVVYFLTVKHFYPLLLERGQFGDMFGGLNTVFSSLAFIGVIIAIILQREELSLQRNELELTREELKKTAEAQVKSEQALRKQVVSLEKTAKLNGLSSILQYHGSELVSATTGVSGHDTQRRDKARIEAEKVQQKIEQLIKDE